MGSWEQRETAIGIVSDPCNYAAEQFFEKQLSLSSRNCPNCQSYRIVPDALTHPIDAHALNTDLGSKFAKNYAVVVAIVGVPDASGYKQEIHTLLDSWAKAKDKPTLLLVSSKPELTRQIVNEWQLAKKLPTELQAAIKVNDEFLVINGAKALDVLKERVAYAGLLNQQLEDARNPDVSPLVAEPLFMRSASLAVPQLIKG